MQLQKLDNGTGNTEMRAWHQQLDRVDPAKKSLAIQGSEDNDLTSRTKTLEDL